MYISKSKRSHNAKPAAYYFYVKTKISVEFHISISLPLRNIFLKEKNEQSRDDYRKQRNLCVALVRRAKQQYFSMLELSLIADNKNFWKIVKPLFSDKISHRDIISLTEDGKTVTEDLQIAEIFISTYTMTTLAM